MNINKQKYIEHIDDAEQLIVMRKLLDKIEKTLNTHTVENTDFLDPYQRHLAYSILNRFNEIKYREIGGYQEAERKVIQIYLDYITDTEIENPVKAVRISGSFKFNEINHRDYLGAILALGIKREKIGDIVLHEGYGELILLKEVKDYFKNNLSHIGRESVSIRDLELDEVVKQNIQYDYVTTTVQSLRLDAVISSTYNVSRSSSSNMIVSNKVKVNWRPTDTVALELKEGDTISVRGYGRFKVLSNEGLTKKGRFRIQIGIIK